MFYSITNLQLADWFPLKSRNKIMEAISSGKLKAIDISVGKGRSTYRISDEEVKKFLESL